MVSRPFVVLFLLEMYLVVVVICLHFTRVLTSAPTVSPLQWAVRKGKIASVKAFIGANVDPNAGGTFFGLISFPWSFVGPFGISPLCDAAKNGDGVVGRRLMKLLIDAGTDPNVGSTTGPLGLFFSASPLMYAIESGEVSAVRLLLDAGANPNVGYTFGPFGWITSLPPLAEVKGDREMAKALIDAGADPSVGITFGPFGLFSSGFRCVPEGR